MEHPTFSTIVVNPLSRALGAEIEGVDLSQPLEDAQFKDIQNALFTFGAIGFRDQTLSHQNQIDFALRFGTLEVHPIVKGMEGHPEIIRMHKPAGTPASFGVGWHSDNSFFDQPSLGSVVYAETVPPVGGDTLFANQQLAYDMLSDGLKETLEGLVAIHSAKEAYTSPTALEKYDSDGPISYKKSDVIEKFVEHPVIIKHPVTGKKALYVNAMFTHHFKGWTIEESKPLLEFLCAHATREDFQCRFKWEKNSLVIWDNRVVQHAALNDYVDYDRTLYRVTVNGTMLN